MKKLIILMICLLISICVSAGTSKKLRFLHLNVFGRDQKECKSRYLEIAKRIHKAKPVYDVITLNEHWNTVSIKGLACDGSYLTKLIQAGGKYPHSLTHLPRQHHSDDLLVANGGNSLFSRYPIEKTHTSKFTNSGRMPLMGDTLARIKVDNNLSIDVWLTHLEANSDGCLDEELCRLEQLDDLSNDIVIFSSNFSDGDVKRNPVLVTGDFNIGGPLSIWERLKHLKDEKLSCNKYKGNPGYEWIMEYFEDDTRDLWLEANLFNLPIGHTYDCLVNDMLDCDYRERLDYLFVMGDKFFKQSATHKVDLKLMGLTYDWKTPSGMPVSDHYGLDTTLEFQTK